MTKTGKLSLGLAAIALTATSVPAIAGWKRIETEATDVGNGAFVATPQSEWNRWSRRPAKRGETWTKDGFQLNRLDFFGQIEAGQSIYKDRHKKERPLPKFRADMLPTDLAELFEANFSIEHDITQFDVRLLEPVKLGGHDGIRMVYEYALPNDALTRVGEARLATVDDQLYVINFTAPELHYFEASIGEIRTIMDGVALR
jgi:hypothetical protein